MFLSLEPRWGEQRGVMWDEVHGWERGKGSGQSVNVYQILGRELCHPHTVNKASKHRHGVQGTPSILIQGRPARKAVTLDLTWGE